MDRPSNHSLERKGCEAGHGGIEGSVWMATSNPFTIIIDTREQTPWAFPDEQPLMSAALPAGDYSIAGYEQVIALERKSLNDLVGTVIRDRDRFHRELVKLKSYRRKAVVIEASIADVFECRYKSEAHPYSILGAVQSLHMTFDIPFLWWHSREYAQWMAAKWFEHAWKKIQKWEAQGEGTEEASVSGGPQ